MALSYNMGIVGTTKVWAWSMKKHHPKTSLKVLFSDYDEAVLVR